MDKKDAFIAAIRGNEGLIYKIASVYTNNAEDRADLVQEITYQLWKSFDSFSQRAALGTWMYRVAMNVAIHHLKSAKKRVETTSIEHQLSDLPEPEYGDEEERWRVLKHHVDQLNLLDKGIVIVYLEGKSYEEIAEIVGISVSNVGTRLSRIKEKLKQQISKQL